MRGFPSFTPSRETTQGSDSPASWLGVLPLRPSSSSYPEHAEPLGSLLCPSLSLCLVASILLLTRPSALASGVSVSQLPAIVRLDGLGSCCTWVKGRTQRGSSPGPPPGRLILLYFLLCGLILKLSLWDLPLTQSACFFYFYSVFQEKIFFSLELCETAPLP